MGMTCLSCVVEFLRFLLGAMPVATIPAMVTILRTRLLGTRLPRQVTALGTFDLGQRSPAELEPTMTYMDEPAKRDMAPGHARKRSCHPDIKRVVQDETRRYLLPQADVFAGAEKC
jgi:hypothetical protein